jgi:hypothetical protein
MKTTQLLPVTLFIQSSDKGKQQQKQYELAVKPKGMPQTSSCYTITVDFSITTCNLPAHKIVPTT